MTSYIDKNFYFILIWNLLSSTNCMPLGLITWRHHPEISCDEHKCTWKPGNMVERHLWTKHPQLFLPEKFLLNCLKGKKMLFEFLKKNLCGFFVRKWRSTIFPICGFFVQNSQIGVNSQSEKGLEASIWNICQIKNPWHFVKTKNGFICSIS